MRAIASAVGAALWRLGSIGRIAICSAMGSFIGATFVEAWGPIGFLPGLVVGVLAAFGLISWAYEYHEGLFA